MMYEVWVNDGEHDGEKIEQGKCPREALIRYLVYTFSLLFYLPHMRTHLVSYWKEKGRVTKVNVASAEELMRKYSDSRWGVVRDIKTGKATYFIF